MPNTEVRVFQDSEGKSEFNEWLVATVRRRKLRSKCLAMIFQLASHGNELRRPSADFLRDGVYELRFKYSNVNYRILYGFIGRSIAIVSHVTTKLDKVANKDIDIAVQRLMAAKESPETYTVEFDIPNGENP